MRFIDTQFNGRPAQVRVKEPFSHDRSIIAIDPDLTKSGVAHIMRGSVVHLEALDLLSLQAAIPQWKATGELVLMEDIDNSKTTFKHGKAKGKALHRISRNVGAAQGTARHILSFLRDGGIEPLLIEPLKIPEKQHSKKGTDAAAFFKALTGWDKRTNEDMRDAAIIGLYGLPLEYNVCDQQHVYASTRNQCPACYREEQHKAKRRARAAANKRNKAHA